MGSVAERRVVSHESEADSWRFAFGRPIPQLSGYVTSYCDYAEQTSSFTRRRELPTDRITMIINLGEPIRVGVKGEVDVWSRQDTGFVAGLTDTYALTDTGGSQAGIQVELTPVGAHLLLRLPMHEVTNQVVRLEQLFDAGAELLREALASAGNSRERFGLIDSFFLARLDDTFSPVPSVTRALGRLKQSAGTVSVEQLASEIGCSRRHLVTGFREQVGVPPKLLARILRFEHAVSLVDSGDGLGWAEIAQACGYYDQAHLIGDFKQFSGSPPVEFARRRLPDGGGMIGD